MAHWSTETVRESATAGLQFQPARVGVMGIGTPARGVSMLDIARFALSISQERDLHGAASMLQREACRVTRSSEALCVIFDWARRAAWTIHGPVLSPQVQELVAEVAGNGRRLVVGDAVLEPIGRAPSRAVIAVRRHVPYTGDELTALAALANGVTATFERLLTQRTTRATGRP